MANSGRMVNTPLPRDVHGEQEMTGACGNFDSCRPGPRSIKLSTNAERDFQPAPLHRLRGLRVGGKAKDRTMMFLLRTAFWLAVVLALLPSFGPKASTPAATGVEATEAVTAASATLGDMFQFCSRQPNACATGVHLASAIGQRAQAGAKMIYGMVGDKLAKTEGAGDESTPANLSTADVKVSQNTLTPADLMPVWRGSRQRDKGAI
jgi:hypothetical protein